MAWLLACRWMLLSACLLSLTLAHDHHDDGQSHRGGGGGRGGGRPTLDRLRETMMGRGRQSSRRVPAEADEALFWSKTGGGEKMKAGANIRDRFNLGGSDPLSNDDQLAFFRNVLKNGVEPFDALTSAVNSKPMQALLENTEIQHRLMEHYPALAAFEGFKQASGRRLAAEETKAGFVEGVKNMLVFFKNSMATLKDRDATGDVIMELAQSTSPQIQSLFSRARTGDKMAIDEIGDLVKLRLFPEVDPKVLREVASKMDNRQLLAMPEIMRFIDEDPYMAHFIRNPPDGSAFVSQGGQQAR